MLKIAASYRRMIFQTVIALTVALSFAGLAPFLTKAQTTTEPTVYAITELNLRKGPSIDDTVIAFVPRGAQVQRAPGEVTNDYAPVIYNGLTGWVVALGLVASPELVDPAEPVAAPDSAPVPAPLPSSSNTRVTLAPLMLRDGPSADAEVLAGMPEGSVVTLTREGAENGYVTVDYGGLEGWAYADLLGETHTNA